MVNIAFCASSGSISVIGPRTLALALNTTIFGGPKADVQFSNNFCTCPLSAVSHWKVVAPVSDVKSSNLSTFRAASMTLSPLLENLRASDALRPDPEPTIKATSLLSIIFSSKVTMS